MRNPYRKWIVIISSLSLLVGLWLVVNEVRTPGFCPPFPVIGVPTCYLVLVYFLMVLGSQLVDQRYVRSILFQVGAISGFATAIWFSVHQYLGMAQCPVLFAIPLCYVAFFTFLALITLNQAACIDEKACSIS